MTRANHNRLLNSVSGFGLFGLLLATFVGACTSSSSENAASGGTSNTATGGAAATTTTPTAGTSSSAGGAAAAGGTTSASATTTCDLDAGVTGNTCGMAQLTFSISDNSGNDSCATGVWATDNTATAYIFAPWCTGTADPNTCSLSMACSSGSVHITGDYSGSESGDGLGGLGLNLNVPIADAGGACAAIDASSYKGVTLDVTDTTVPGNTLLVGVTLKDGNAGEYTQNLTAGAQTVQIPWNSFVMKHNCSSAPGPGIVAFYFVFHWYNDNAAHAVDMTISNVGLYQ
jgi:hypothetical protein